MGKNPGQAENVTVSGSARIGPLALRIILGALLTVGGGFGGYTAKGIKDGGEAAGGMQSEQVRAIARDEAERETSGLQKELTAAIDGLRSQMAIAQAAVARLEVAVARLEAAVARLEVAVARLEAAQRTRADLYVPDTEAYSGLPPDRREL